MKLLFCLMCGELVQMTSKEIRMCPCGNVRGRYKKDGGTLEVRFKNVLDARIVGITNSFLREENIPFGHSSYEGTLFKGRKSHIIMVRPFTTGDVVYLPGFKE